MIKRLEEPVTETELPSAEDLHLCDGKEFSEIIKGIHVKTLLTRYKPIRGRIIFEKKYRCADNNSQFKLFSELFIIVDGKIV